MKQLLLSLVLVAVLLACQSALAVDASAVWNNFHAQYNFSPYPQAPGTTFEQAYLGSDFAADFAAIKSAVAASLMSYSPGFVGDDLLNESVEDWP